jgi:Thiol-activated cytolysin
MLLFFFLNPRTHVTLKSYILGSSTQAANQSSLDLESFIDFIKNDGNWTPDKPAQPISYCLRFVKDGQIASLHSTTEFVQRDCRTPNKSIATITVDKLIPNKNGRDFCGKISAKAYYKDASGQEKMIIGSEKIYMNVECVKGKWWKDTKIAGRDINVSNQFQFEESQSSTGFVRIFFDIRDGIQDIERIGNQKEYNQYEIKQMDIPINSIDNIPIRIQKLYMEGKSNQSVDFHMSCKLNILN